MVTQAALSSALRPIDPAQARPALEGFFRIVALWGADNDQVRAILGGPPERTFFKWKRGDVGGVPMDVLRRVGYVAGIWKALQILYSDVAQADAWPSKPNRAFNGQTPLERMSAGDVTDLAAVRDYLDSARSPWS